MLRMSSSNLAIRASLSLPCCASSLRSISIRRRASSSSKSPALDGKAAASARSAPAAIDALLTRVLDVRAPVLRPGLLVVAGRQRLLLAVADGLDAAVSDAQHRHHLLHRLGATLAEGEVVLAAAALVAVALDADARVALVAHVARVRLDQPAILVLHDVRVIFEEHAALGKDVARVAQRVAGDRGLLRRPRGRARRGLPRLRHARGAVGDRCVLACFLAGAPRGEGRDGEKKGDVFHLSLLLWCLNDCCCSKKVELARRLQLVGIGPHAGSWTSPAVEVSRWRTRPSPETAARLPRPPTEASYRIILPFGAKLGESSRAPSVRAWNWPVASSSTAMRKRPPSR